MCGNAFGMSSFGYLKYTGVVLSALVLVACASERKRPSWNEIQELQSKDYTLATWYSISKKGKPLRVYIEGDGYSFTKDGRPTDNPTPRHHFWQNIAKVDPNPNVAYLARPCQYIQSKKCSVKDWTTGRFSKEIIESMDNAILELMRKAETDKVILLGYSGGGQVAAMLAVQHPQNTLYLYTVAGVLDHDQWTRYHKATPLSQSRKLDIKNIYTIPQMHFVGENDKVLPPSLTQYVMPGYMITVVPNATHMSGWDEAKKKLYKKVNGE